MWEATGENLGGLVINLREERDSHGRRPGISSAPGPHLLSTSLGCSTQSLALSVARSLVKLLDRELKLFCHRRRQSPF